MHHLELACSCLLPQEARIIPLHTSWVKGVYRLVRQLIEQDCVQVLDIHTLPREVVPAWFSQLMRIDEVMDISLFSLPQASATAMQHFERHARSIQKQENDRYPDPERVATQEDIERLTERITIGHDRVLQFAVHVLMSKVTCRLSPTNTPLPGWAYGIQRSNHFFTGDFLSSAW